MKTLHVLQRYEKRQVVLSVYTDDELMSRDGFFFDQIGLNPDRIVFIHNNRTINEIIIDPSFQFIQLLEFSHYYAIEQNRLRIELYFPY